jgi:deoxyribodipyrimidine photo-lyase
VSDDGGEALPPAGPLVAPAGTREAHRRLSVFLLHLDRYPDDRDVPSLDATSGLSIDLHLGTLSAREVIEVAGRGTPGADAFVRQLAWRDWFAHLLVEAPSLVDRPLRASDEHIAWRSGAAADADFEAWCAGRTGYPLVDAGMRQLRTTGTMHNRVRMVAASFLVKDLLIDWRRGERWFRRWLADGDVAQNVGNWQWVAGTGPDAAPYFRVLNPVTQSRRFDPHGSYIRRWVPELAPLDDRAIHAPWDAAPLDLAARGIVVGDTYPAPLVDHAVARARALEAYRSARSRP